MFSLDGYRGLQKRGGVVRRTDRAVLAVTGRDRATWLQGLVTNDIESLAEGASRYAAYLTPQGRMITDMNIVARPDRLLLDVPAPLAGALRDRLDGLIFSEDAQVLDGSDSHEVWTIAESNDGAIVDTIGDRGQPPPSPYPEVALDTFEVVRVERGVPKFLVDMDEHTIPLEAAIEDRAISFTKGCYVGQEVIVRVTHRGGGRVARRLVRWQSREAVENVPAAGSKILANDRDIGRITSAVFSPSYGRVMGLGYVHRDFTEPGTAIAVVWDDSRLDANVV